MISKEELRQLAEVQSKDGCAISFYFQAPPPPDKSHRKGVLEAKDAIQDAIHRAEQEGKPMHLRRELERILEHAESFRGQHDHAKVIFSCPDQNIWREFDVPARLGETRVYVNSRFHFRPLRVLESGLPNCIVGAVDRARARIFHYVNDSVTELEDITNEDLPRRGRGDGFAGFDGGHAERHFENEAMRHFKAFADRLQAHMEAKGADHVLIACRDEIRPDVERHLHQYVQQRLLGQFSVDPALVSEGEIREEADRMIATHRAGEHEGLVRQVMGETQRDGNGALGLRAVLQALERGEVQTLVVGERFSSPAVECTHCGHLDSRISDECGVCGKENRELSNVVDALHAFAQVHGAEIEYVRGVNGFADNSIGALLRFRADQNTAEKLAS